MRVKDLVEQDFQKFKTIVSNGIETDQASGVILERLYKEMGYEFGLRTVQRYMSKWKAPKDEQAPGRVVEKPGKPPKDAREGKRTMKGQGTETAEVDYWTRKRVRTLDDAIEKAEVDLTKWDVKDWEVTFYECAAKDKTRLEYNQNNQLTDVDTDMAVTPLCRVSLKLRAKKGWSPSEFRELLLADMKALAPVYEYPVSKELDPELMAELAIFDAHFGKLAWRMETGQDYDIKICRNRYMGAGLDLLSRAEERECGRLCYVLGNDFFHADHRNTTTSGTPQDCDGRWQKAFRTGKDCAIELIERACMFAAVDIVIVPGNHDEEKAFTLGEVLEARFHNNPKVVVFNQPDQYKYYRWGKSLIGFVHGQNHASDKKRAQLPIQMLRDRPVDCSEAVWLEWHLGHFHSEQEDVWKYRTVDHVQDVAVRVLPSLSSTDAWHRQQGYQSVLAAEMHIYHKQKGRHAYEVHQAEAA